MPEARLGAATEQERQLVVVRRGLEVAMAQSMRLNQADEQIDEARKRFEEQKTRIQRLIVQGAPSQAAEDLLCKLQEAVQRAMRKARSLR
jgi:hypothetical protein